MMRRLLCIAFVVLAASRVSAQTCTPTPIRTLIWGTPGQTIVPPNEDKTSNLVPAGKVWLIKAAGIGQGADPGVAIEYRLQIDHIGTDLTFWYTAIEVYPLMRGTPVLALTRPIILEAGERLSARSNSMPNGGTMYVMALGWEFPASCLSTLLGLTSSSGTTSAPLDFSALITATTTLQTAANALQAAIPR